MLSLGERMKFHEQASTSYLPPRSYAIIRVDGRAFHTALKRYGVKRPFDESYMEVLDETAKSLCSEIQNAKLAYGQSDEISIVATDVDNPKSGHWFGGSISKMISVSAARATSAFMWNARVLMGQHWSVEFDSRVILLPDEVEVANYFLYRQRDWMRNAVSMAARAYFSHGEMQGKSVVELKEMLAGKGVKWEEYSEAIRMGRVCVREAHEDSKVYLDPRLGEAMAVDVVRHSWEVWPAPAFSADPDGWLAQRIPAFGGGK